MNDTDPAAAVTLQRRERLSALMDGELDSEAADGCCAHWREHGDARASWHAYHLIGDVLRSEELACGGARGARLLEAVRGRLAAEPVVLAPAASAEETRPRRRPVRPASVALAVGAMAVAGMAVMQGQGALWPRQDASLAAAPVPAAPVALVSLPSERVAVAGGRTPASAAEASPSGDDRLIRDAQLDRYLAAHKQFGGSSALGVPSGFLRSATLQAPAR